MSEKELELIFKNEKILKKIKTLIYYLEQMPNNSRFKELSLNHKLVSAYLILTNKTNEIEFLDELIYKYKPPTIDEFLTPDYIGSASYYYTPETNWGKSLREFFSPNSSYYEMILSGAIGCVIGTTKIALVDGTIEKIENLVGKKVKVFSWDIKNNKLVEGLATNIHCSGKNVDIFEVNLINEKQKIITWRGTWNHPFLLNNGEYVIAKDLKAFDCIQSSFIDCKNNKNEIDILISKQKFKSKITVLSVKKLKKKQDVYDLTVDNYHNFGIYDGNYSVFFTHNTGKSFISRVALFYNLHRINCLREPQVTMGTDKIAPIYLQLIGLSKESSKNTILEPFANMIKNCKYYEEVKKESDLEVTRKDGKIPFISKPLEILFPKGIRVQAGSILPHALSKDIFSCVIEETDFKENRLGVTPLTLYKAMVGRIKSRFFNKGNFRSKYLLSIIISSVTYDTAPISMYIKDIPPDSPYTKIFKFAHWDIFKPDTDKHFYIQVGTTAHPHRMFESEEDINLIDNKLYKTPYGCLLLKIPKTEDYLATFRNNIEWGIQTVAGIATSSFLHPFSDFTKCKDLNLTKEIFIKSNYSDTIPLWQKLPLTDFAEALETPVGNQKFKFKRYPNAPRYIARDDAMSCIAGFSVSHKERGKDGRIIAVYDLVIEIGTDTQIQMRAIDQLCIDLVSVFGVNLKAISLDTFQTVSSIQFLKNHFKNTNSIDIQTISVDRNIQGYSLLSSAILENQVRWGNCPRLETMLGGIFYENNKPYATKEIMDGRKDSPDAVCRNIVSMFLNHLEDEPVNIYENYELFKNSENSQEEKLKTLGFSKII